MGLRELLILILILAIVGVILRGLYVAIHARRGQLRMQLDKNIPQYDPDELSLSELPNGGARSVERSFAHVVQKNSEFSAKDHRKIARGEHAIPVLMDTVDGDDEEEVEIPRRSGVATARESARQKHSKGHGKDDALDLDGVAVSAAAQQDSTVSATSVVEQKDQFDNDYDDPLDAHVFIDEDDESPTHNYGDYRDPVAQQDDDHNLDEDDSSNGPSEDSVDPDGYDYDDREDEFDDGPSENSADPDGFEDEDDDWDDDDEMAEDEQGYQDDDAWEDEDDAEDEEVDTDAPEFDDVYRDKTPDSVRAYDDLADDWEDDSPEPEADVSATRRWFQWAGDKISSMGASQDEPVREREFHGQDREEPVIGFEDFDDEPETREAPRPPISKQPLDKSRQAQLFEEDEVEDESVTAPVSARDRHAHKPSKKAADVPSRPSEPEPEAPKEYSEVMVINVVAKPEREFAGVDLLPALLASGLRFGDMSIFHRHFDSSAQSPVIFSVANMLNPGTFDLNQINDFATRGLCFFMTLPNAANSMQAFDRMLDAAQTLRITLDGDLKDDNRSVMTAQTIEHYRQRVRDFDLRQLRQSK